ncbi:hypothetical protein [Bifidobacterium moukalabense]|uniref:hypothetical protein n=1 Tax=Bifidobacterium moukalabense TaxID=1333651 RepID=UPI0010F9241E|nr:hypothetical protein [Bifidobacterium moukalabense]
MVGKPPNRIMPDCSGDIEGTGAAEERDGVPSSPSVMHDPPEMVVLAIVRDRSFKTRGLDLQKALFSKDHKLPGGSIY